MIAASLLASVLAPATWAQSPELSFDEHVARAAEEGRIEARGTWRTDDGKMQGVWQLLDPPALSAEGLWRGALMVRELPGVADGSKSMLNRATRKGDGRVSRVAVEGSLSPEAIGLWVVRPESDVMNDDAAEQGAVTIQTLPAFPGAASAKLLGAEIDGEFTSPHGEPGRWDGWFHVWQYRSLTGETTDVPPRVDEMEPSGLETDAE